jgi:uncharacterized membrane protein
MNEKVLIAGESWMTHSIHVKGFDSFTTSSYEEGVGFLRDALTEGGWDVTFQPNHIANRDFPTSIETLRNYKAVILSDIGSNTLLLHPDTFGKSEVKPNRLDVIANYVRSGGGLIMVGGYLSFQGIDGKANYHGTPIEDILPVRLQAGDDRVELPQGRNPLVIQTDHPSMQGLPEEWPPVLGYNRLILRPEGQLIAVLGEDPFVAVRQVEGGRSAVFASDCGPHWAPLTFVQWEGYKRLWNQLIGWVGQC